MENIWQWVESNQSILLAVLAAGILLILFLLLWQNSRYRKLEKRIKAHESGALDKTLEQEAKELRMELERLSQECKEEKRRLTRFMAKEKKAIKKVRLIKYDAFATQGGKVSYALALLNEENSGVLINSIHSTDFSFSYAKEVVRGEVDQVMSKEEQAVLEKAVSERERLSSK
ncbi:hypothetical protein C3V36_04815 [Lachnospiraceae bacterium oral taxon 500]|nr:hypothetical protein C3V36_04815 [Lachnospiraceae bacterium oral taxon 500]